MSRQHPKIIVMIVGDPTSASRHVRLLANLGDLRGVDAVFNKGVDTRGI